METVALDSLHAISMCAPCDMFKDLRSRSSTSIDTFRKDKDFEHAMKGVEREVKVSPTRLSSNVLTSSPNATISLDDPTEQTTDPTWGRRYDTRPSQSSFSSTKQNVLKQNKGKGKTKLSKFGQYSTVVVKKRNEANDKKTTMSISELKLKEVQLISTLGKLTTAGGNASKGVSFVFGEINPTVENHCRKNILPLKAQNPASSLEYSLESISDNNSVGTSSTAESSEYEEELSTVLSRIQLAASQPSSLRYQFGEELWDCDLVDVADTKKEVEEQKMKKEFVQRPQADHLLAVQEESLRQAMERQRKKKESQFW